MTGTPAANRPTDVYYQMQFLHPDFWKQHGFRNKTVFDAHFCLFSNVPMGGRTIQQVIGYKNQEQLRDILATMSTRLRQEDVLPHLPPQRWQEFPFDLTPHQLRLYDELDAEVADLLQNYGVGEDDDLADQKLRLMDQVASGFMYENVDEKNRVTHDMPDNPRLDALKAIVEDNEKPLVIWATYVREVEHIFQAFPGRCVGVEDRRRWHAGEKQLLVMKPSQCAEGLTLNEADTSVFYSNSFKADDRWQAEKRNHRMGQDNPVLYIDLVGRKTRDRHKLHALRNKWDYQAFIMNEEGRKWRTNC